MELEIIDSISRLVSQSSKGDVHPVGIGDDAAIVRIRNQTVLMASDMLLDGVHFNVKSTPPYLIGRKALAVNLSDIAAMAGTPVACTVSLAIQRGLSSYWILEVMKGIKDLADQFEVAVVGGDTNYWDGPFSLNVSIVGNEHPKGSVLRSGASADDRIFVTGPLGGSISGKQFTFTPRVKEAQWLRDHFDITSMIDISDGLSTDLRHILKSSGVGAKLFRDRIPRNQTSTLNEASGLHDRQPRLCTIDEALTDGEDFELCFTLRPDDAVKIFDFAPRHQVQIFEIGSVTSSVASLMFDDGTAIESRGYQHR
ncbi:MAG: thiamine-phosphate kinase [Proteobacteria bacterium]|nr:thiamine-phosphate kinase [Pseudomonadota bacterium]